MNQYIRTALRHGRQLVLSGSRSLGVFKLIANSSWRTRRLLILCYHGVSLHDEHEWDPQLFVTPEFLRRRFELLRNMKCNVLPFGQAVQLLQDGMLPPRSVALTFDDGFYNFLSAAMPILEEFRFPATNYVSSYHSIHQRPIMQLTMRYMLWSSPMRELPAGMLPGVVKRINLDVPAQNEEVFRNLLEQARSLSGDRTAQQAWLRDIAIRLNVDWDGIISKRLFHLMTADELREAATRGFDIQLHTHRHRTPRDKQVFLAEVQENRQYLESLTGQPAVHFCYPSGDVDPVFFPWLHELKVTTATTVSAGLAHRHSDPLLLPRYVDTMAQNDTVYESWLSGTNEFLRRRVP